jgi:hypothetical protein
MKIIKIIISKICENANWNAFASTNASGLIFIDFKNPAFFPITVVAEFVTERKKLNIIKPKNKYKGYLFIELFKTPPPKNKSITKKDRGSSKYQKTPR